MVRKDESGQGLMEYSLAIVLIAILVMVILILLAPGVGNMLNSVVTKI